MSDPLTAFSNIEPQLQAAMGAVRDAGSEVAIAARQLNNTVANNQDQIPRHRAKSRTGARSIHDRHDEHQ